jgi:2-methylcitrate dehydratase
VKTLSEQISEYVETLKFKDINEESLYKLKQHLLDTLSCILYGLSSIPASIIRKLSQNYLLGIEENTVVGINKKTSLLTAVLANGVALRESEYMDYLVVPNRNSLSVSHPCETIPGALAVAEKVDSTGKDFLLSLFIGYELHGRFCASIPSFNLSSRGWHHTTLGYLIEPLVIGKLLNLNSSKLVNAVGISGCMANLGIIDAEGEEYEMVKNIAFPLATHASIVATLLAMNGFTGTRRIIEGEKGFVKSIIKDDLNLDRLLKGEDKAWILETRLKPYPIAGAALGIADAILTLINKHNNIEPNKIKSIIIRSNERTIIHTGDPVKKHPRNKDTADHSAPFIISLAILKRKIEPDLFIENMYFEPKVSELINRVEFEIAPELNDPKIYPAAEVIIKMNSGAEYSNRTLYHKGHPKNPMSKEETERKFLKVASSTFGEERAKDIIKIVYKLEKIGHISEFTELLRPQ